MPRPYRILLSCILLLSATNGYGADSISPQHYFKDVSAGQEVSIKGSFTDEGDRIIRLTPVPPAEGKQWDVEKPVLSADKQSLSFTIPTTLPDGRYLVEIILAGTQLSAGELRIPKPAEAEVKVEAVYPVHPYPNPEHKYNYDFVILGTNFAPELKDNHVYIDDKEASLIFPCPDVYRGPCLKNDPASGSETRKLFVDGYAPESYSHPLGVRVRVGNGTNISKPALPLTFSRLPETYLKLTAIAAFLLLLLIIYWLVRAGIKLGKINGEKYGSLRAFLIDKETNSYSLSKFQLTLFTLVTVFGYIYVFVCRLFVQWKFELPPVPEGLPGMMAVSLGTTVVAAGIGAKIGGKGAGPTSPSLGDFITSGGVVLPERFQFFLWTIVSSMGVLVLILASDPVTVTELPKLPDGMLYLMGLSSAGYLGGKLVRGPGPSIKSIDVGRVDVPEKPAEGDKPAEPACTILDVDITGDNLSPDATFQLDDERIPAAQVHVADRKVEGQDARFCSMLKVELKNVAERYFDGPHLFRIINPDSQGADIKYGTKLDSVGDLKAGDVPVLVTVTGTNFKDPSSAEWKDAAKTVSVIDAKQVTKKTDTQLEITLTPGPVGKGTLTIKSPKQLKTSIEVIVGAGSETPPQPDATVESVSPIQAGDQPVQVTVTGANFKDSSEAVWTDAAGTVTPVPAANITKKSDTELEITLTPGNAGPATLEIKSPGGLTTTVDVTVE